MKLELTRENFKVGSREYTLYVLGIDFNVYWQQFPRDSVTWGYKFVEEMDERFIEPFDLRRTRPWEKSKVRVHFWYTYVTVPERFK